MTRNVRNAVFTMLLAFTWWVQVPFPADFKNRVSKGFLYLRGFFDLVILQSSSLFYDIKVILQCHMTRNMTRKILLYSLFCLAFWLPIWHENMAGISPGLLPSIQITLPYIYDNQIVHLSYRPEHIAEWFLLFHVPICVETFHLPPYWPTLTLHP